jgi:hypothetical protein
VKYVVSALAHGRASGPETAAGTGGALLQDFYGTVTQAAFTFNGLWWILAGLKFDEWMRDRLQRRRVYDITLYFLLPGMISLISLLAVEERLIWRFGFGIGATLGALEAVYSLRSARRFGERSLVFLSADALSIVVYAANAAVAIKPSLLETVGIGLKPLEVEGILIAILLGLGLFLAAVMFIRSATVIQEA